MLVETFPERNLPLLRALVEQSSVEDLKAITGHSNTYDGQWGPRRQLVWLTERLARFVDFFPDAERILRRLALAESEPQIGNNATHIWQQLFRIYLSGSATPFLSRLPILEQQIFSQNQAAVSLAFGALWEVFNPQPLRMEGRPVAGGRIAPADWSPDSEKELRACRDASFDLIHKAAKSRESNVSGLAKEFLIRFLPSFLSQGWLDRLRDALSPSSLPPTSNPKLVERVEEFLQLHEGRNGDHDSSNKKSAYLARVGKWLEELQPKEFAARLVNTVGRNPWGHSARGAESAWQQDVAHLGQEILDSPRCLCLRSVSGSIRSNGWPARSHHARHGTHRNDGSSARLRARFPRDGCPLRRTRKPSS